MLCDVLLEAGIGAWRDGAELCLHALADLQRVYKLGDGFAADTLAGAGERLERLVGIGIALATEDGLDGLGHHGPVVLKVGGNLALVQYQLAQSLLQRFQRYH